MENCLHLMLFHVPLGVSPFFFHIPLSATHRQWHNAELHLRYYSSRRYDSNGKEGHHRLRRSPSVRGALDKFFQYRDAKVTDHDALCRRLATGWVSVSPSVSSVFTVGSSWRRVRMQGLILALPGIVLWTRDEPMLCPALAAVH